MGINVIEPYGDDAFLVGLFCGLFLWYLSTFDMLDFATGKTYVGNPVRRSVGAYKITGM